MSVKGIDMKKELIFRTAVSVIIMLILPWLAAAFANGDAGMAVCILLFYVINPLYALLVGFAAGKDIRRLWSMPVIPAVLFPAGAWTFFARRESAFLLYAAVYLILGAAAMLVSALIRMFLRNRNSSVVR